MEIIDIIPGVKVYKEENFSMLIGCPPEIIKHLILLDISFPDYILLPDTIYKNAVLQNATEFPLYYFLFVQGNYFKGKKLTILGKKEHVDKNHQLLNLTLLGPTKEEFNKLGDSKYFDCLYRESRALSVKDKDNNEIPLDQFVSFIHFENQEIINNDFHLIHKDFNIYQINGNIIDVNFEEEQLPPYDLKPDFVPMLPTKFGIDILGGASGFTANNPSSGLVLNYNGDYMLVDVMPYLEHALNARGISKQQIKSLFLTHIHDDHCNMFPLVLFNNKIKFLGTKEIFWMACQKLSLMTMHDIEEFYSYFDFIELKPYEETDFYGIKITPHYTVHSIPTIGATFKMKQGRHDRSIVFVGDNKSLSDIQTLSDNNIVTKEKNNRILKLYRDHYDFLFADGGLGILHGDPKDSLESKANRVVFLHLEKLPEEFDATFTLATHGKRFIIEDADERYYLIKTMQILNQHYPGISEDWENTLLSNMHILKYNKGDVIMKQGEDSNNMIYIILSGNTGIFYHDGKKLKEVSLEETGDIIGDMAVINQVKKRSASIIARTPVTLCEISGELFYSFIKEEKRIDSIQTAWQIRSKLEIHYPFTEFSDLVNLRIARVSNEKVIDKDSEILKEGEIGKEFYILINGKLSAYSKDKKIGTLLPGAMFGEFSGLSNKARIASIISEEESVILEIAQEDMNQILSITPSLNFYLHNIMKERSEAFDDAL